jgi:D-beta-D-heptose 7-phosphate kinase/D-beta-D-heptose 1-phosphate adenosyltransferase
VLVSTVDLPDLAGKVSMVSGGFDPLHPGHVEYFEAAARLGMPLLCNVSADHFVRRKHAPLLTQDERGRLIDALACVSYVYLAELETVDVLEALRPRFLVKGGDWRGRLPPDEVEVCARHGVEVVFLDTVTNSSSGILRRFLTEQQQREIELLAEQE